MPSLIELHTSSELIERWIDYGTLDSELTYYLYHALKHMMMDLPISFKSMKHTFDTYQNYWLPFGEMLTDIERVGIRVNKDQLLVC